MRMMVQLTVVVTALLVFSASGIAADSESAVDKQRAILVTGASTGIGRKIAAFSLRAGRGTNPGKSRLITRSRQAPEQGACTWAIPYNTKVFRDCPRTTGMAGSGGWSG